MKSPIVPSLISGRYRTSSKANFKRFALLLQHKAPSFAFLSPTPPKFGVIKFMCFFISASLRLNHFSAAYGPKHSCHQNQTRLDQKLAPRRAPCGCRFPLLFKPLLLPCRCPGDIFLFHGDADKQYLSAHLQKFRHGTVRLRDPPEQSHDPRRNVLFRLWFRRYVKLRAGMLFAGLLRSSWQISVRLRFLFW